MRYVQIVTGVAISYNMIPILGTGYSKGREPHPVLRRTALSIADNGEGMGTKQVINVLVFFSR
jgi:hypothetical protein